MNQTTLSDKLIKLKTSEFQIISSSEILRYALSKLKCYIKNLKQNLGQKQYQ